MSAVALLARARAAGLQVTVDAGRLVVRGPQTAEPLARALLARKADVIAALLVECGYWIGAESRHCGQLDGVRRYLPGYRCPAHTPAAVRAASAGPLPGSSGKQSEAVDRTGRKNR